MRNTARNTSQKVRDSTTCVGTSRTSILNRKPWSMQNSEMGTHGKYDALEAREEVRGWSYTLPRAQSRVTRRTRHQFMRHVGAAMRTVGGGGRIYVFLLRA